MTQQRTNHRDTEKTEEISSFNELSSVFSVSLPPLAGDLSVVRDAR